MKKQAFILFLSLCVTIKIYSQTDRIGFTGGITVASQKLQQGNIAYTYSSKVGYTVGVTADVLISDRFSFQPGLNFTQKGGIINGSDLGGSMEPDVTVTLNYLELPLNFVLYTKAGKGRFVVGAGPSLGLGIGGTIEQNNFSFDVEFGNDNSNDYKPIDLGGNLTVGYEFSNHLFLMLNYNATLNNISTDSDGTIRNRVFGIRMGYFLNSGKKK